MILLTDYDFYKEKYRGEISSEAFEKAIPKASFDIESAINRDLKEEDANNEIVNKVACELVDLISANDYSLNSKNVQSYSIDGVSKVYGKLNKNEFDTEKARILNKLPLEMIRFL